MKRLLLAYDDTDCSQAALNELSQAGLPEKMEVLVLTVADIWVPGDGDGGDPPRRAAAKNVRKAQSLGKEELYACRRIAHGGSKALQELFPRWDIEPFAVAGSPAPTIIEKAKEWRAELIALGSHGKGALQRFLLGSVAQAVANDAACSVHVTRPREEPEEGPLRVAIAVDGSPESRNAVETVLEREWPEETQFQALTVVDARMRTSACRPTFFVDDWIDRHDGNVSEWVCRLDERITNRIKELGWAVESHIFEGDPKKKLLEQIEKWDAHCLFMGARGFDHGQQRSLGTTASALLSRAHCAVEIVR